MSWRQRKLGELVEHFSVRAKDYGGSEGLEFLGVSNESGITSSKYAAEDKAEDYKIIEKGCFAYNPYRINVGSIGYLKEDIKGLISPAYVIFKAKEDQIIPELLLKFLKSDEGLHQIRINARGTVRQALRFEDLANIDISLPDIEEQKVFFDRILKIEEKSEPTAKELNHQLELIINLRKAFLKEAMQGKLVKQNPSDEPASMLLKKIKAEKERLIKEKKLKRGNSTAQSLTQTMEWSIPKRWRTTKVDELFFVTKLAGFEYTKYINLQERGDVPVVRAQNVRPFNLDKTNLLYIDKDTSILLDRCALTREALLVTFIGAGIGDVARFNESQRWHLAPNVAKLEPFESSENYYNLKFINYFFVSQIGQSEIFKHVKATAQPSLSMATIRDIDIPIPPLPEQERIVNKLDDIMQKFDSLEKNIKNSLLQNELLRNQILREAIGIKSSSAQEAQIIFKDEKNVTSKFDSNTLLMEIQELLKIHGKLQALELWQMSKFYGKSDEERNIDGFYAELKKLIEKEKVVKETEKGYLELV